MSPPVDEDFDFQDLEQPKKKSKLTANKKNNNIQFDFEVEAKVQKKPAIKKNKPGSMDNEFLFDDQDQNPKKQERQKSKQKNSFQQKNCVSNQSKNQNLKLPTIVKKQEKAQLSPTNAYLKNKNLTTLQKLEIKKFQVQKKSPKNKSFQDQEIFNQQILNSEIEEEKSKKQKQTKSISKQIQKVKQKQKLIVDIQKQKQKQIKQKAAKQKQVQKKQIAQKKKQSVSQDQNQYQEELFQQIKQENIPKKQQQISKQKKDFNEKAQQKQTKMVQPEKTHNANNKLIEKTKVQIPQAYKKQQSMSSKEERSKQIQKSKNQLILQTPITKYKDLVQKNFPDQQESKVNRMKSDGINRANDKIREMIKSFSNQLTNLIDKNLVLLQKNQKPQIEEEIQGDPIANQLEILRQNKKNNQKNLAITEHQLQNLQKKEDKMQKSTEYIIQLNQQIEAHKHHVNQNKKIISNLKNDVQKQSKKVMTIPQGNSDTQTNGNFKNSLGLRVSIVNLRSQYEKHAQKLKQLENKIQSLQQKLSQANQKKNQAISKAEQNGLCLCSKQEKNKYEQLKKKRAQLSLFEAKHKNAMKSKETVINHQIGELQILLNDYNQKFQTISQSVQFSKVKIFEQIRKAKKSQYVKMSIKQVLQKLQDYMNDDKNSTVSGQQNINSLQYISDKIYKRQYSNSNMKNKNKQAEIPEKKVYKNYLKQVSTTQENIKNKKESRLQLNKKSELTNRKENQRYSQKINSNTNDPRGKKIQTQQKQRKWTQKQAQSNENSSLNPFKNKKNNNGIAILQAKSLALRKNQQQKDVMKNKELMKLIQKNKDKIDIPIQKYSKQKPTNIRPQIQPQQQKINELKKPFQFKLNAKSRLSNKTQQTKYQNINSQRQSSALNIKSDNRQQARQKQKNTINLQVKLADKDQGKIKNPYLQNKAIQQEIKINQNDNEKLSNENNKSTSNNPFKSFKLKKDTNRSSVIQNQYQNKYKIYEQPIKQDKKQQNQLKLPWETNQQHNKQKQLRNINNANNINKIKTQPQKQTVILQQNQQNKQQPSNQITIRPRRLIRKKPQQQQSIGYEATLAINLQGITQKKQQPYDPFKKFLKNKDNQILVNKESDHSKHGINFLNINQNNKRNSIPLSISNNTNEKQSIQENKPKMILFKKNKEQIKKSELPNNQNINVNNLDNILANKEQLKQEDQQKYVRKQREGRVKKQKPNLNSQNSNKNNIYDNVDDLTINLVAQQKQKQHQPLIKNSIGLYDVPNSKIKEMNLNDILGLPQKNKNIKVDADLLLDVNTVSKRQQKPINKKKNDFFDDLDI